MHVTLGDDFGPTIALVPMNRKLCRSYLNEHANFEHFGNALLLLVRVTTNDDWAGLVGDLAVQPPHCDQAAGTCGLNYFVVAGTVSM